MKVAIIGGGISGLGAAYALKDTAHVTVFEAQQRPGGHSHTVNFDHEGEAVSADVGFIVYNELNYPNLIGLLDAIGAPTEPSDMSFSVSAPEGFEWSSNKQGLFARKRNLFRPRYLKFLTEILRFNRTALADLENDEIGSASFGHWLDRHGFKQDLRDNYILPMGAAIWSTPEAQMTEYPAGSFLHFFNNHRLLQHDRPRWRTVSGGSQSYVSRLADILGDRVRTGMPVQSVRKSATGGLSVLTASGSSESFDQVIMATHSDQSMALLSDDFEDRRFTLGSARYQPNHIVLHSDPSLMPKRRAAWASWNVFKQDDGRICLTYWMNKLQNIKSDAPVLVTLNPATMPREDLTHYETHFDHPLFDGAAEAAVREIKRSNGQDGLWFAGAWMGHGFHEDGLKAGLSPALSLGGSVPWEPQGVTIADAVKSRSLGSGSIAAGGAA